MDRVGTHPQPSGLPGSALAAPSHPSARIADRYLAGASGVSLLISLVLHTLLLLAGILVGMGAGWSSGPAGRTGGGDYEMSITAETPLTGLAETELETDAPNVADASLTEVPTQGVLEGSGGLDAPGVGDGLGAISDGLGGAGGGDIGDGEGLGAGGIGGGASFFGVEAKGTRFAYIVDISGSMRGEKIQALKMELKESIGALQNHQSFYVCFFSSDAIPLDDRRKWIDGNQTGKRFANERIAGLDASGGTQPWPAFDLIFSMKPAPDAIYFMTDGIFDPTVADQIQVRNSGSKKVPIHAISFVDKSAEELMRQIAASSGGSYSHVEGPRK